MISCSNMAESEHGLQPPSHGYFDVENDDEAVMELGTLCSVHPKKLDGRIPGTHWIPMDLLLLKRRVGFTKTPRGEA